MINCSTMKMALGAWERRENSRDGSIEVSYRRLTVEGGQEEAMIEGRSLKAVWLGLESGDSKSKEQIAGRNLTEITLVGYSKRGT